MTNLDKKEFLYSIASSEGRVIAAETIGIAMPMLVDITNAEFVAGMGADIIILNLFDVDEYVELVADYVQHLRPDLVLERFVSQSPKELLIAPDWGLKNYEFNHRLQKRMKELGAYQGKLYVN